ncbi:MAG TPA: PD-(D/E)XK nuclease family protein [Dehalococcoidia bacterium]|nr:PD-(D/E)XK nuclease family protein [Dehalococcoidia bacterium]
MSFLKQTEKGIKITAWSFSRWTCYEGCPRKAKYKFIDKLPEPQGEALARGTMLHELAEFFLRGIKKTIPKELELISEVLKKLKKQGALAEAEFAFDKDWKPVEWFSKDAWCRVKADATVLPVLGKGVPTVKVDDFKSGGKADKLNFDDNPEYEMQLELYSLAGLLAYPTAEKAETSLIFIDYGKVVVNEKVFTRSDVPKLKKLWEKRTKRMLADTVFAPNPGRACTWCHFRKSKGGPCSY